MICPRCQSERCRRSKRRSLTDFTVGLTGIRPWRCRGCGLRFYAGAVALAFALTAHCPFCGNFEIQRIARKHVHGWTAWLFRLAHVPAYRCPPCRHHFFSVFPHRIIEPIETTLETPSDLPSESHSESPSESQEGAPSMPEKAH